ncbi:hypothetical protein, partial [Mucilaginibacter pineti]|uniref:hypothetical protein n=1 Tax=Mucilaginibacter pineti TaxID=1391627 RepID=UPI001967E265
MKCQGQAGKKKQNNNRLFMYPLRFIPAVAIFASGGVIGLFLFTSDGKSKSAGSIADGCFAVRVRRAVEWNPAHRAWCNAAAGRNRWPSVLKNHLLSER